jgi:hypothetical protein
VGVKGSRPNQSDSHGGGAHREATMAMANQLISARLARADDLGRSIGKKRTGEGDVELSSTSMPKRGGKGERVGARLGSAMWRRREGPRDLTVGWRGVRQPTTHGSNGGSPWVSEQGIGTCGGAGGPVQRGPRSAVSGNCFAPAQKVIVLFYIYSKTFQTDLNQFD